MPQAKQTDEQRALDLERSLELMDEQERRGRGSAASESEVDDDIIDAIWSKDIEQYRRAISGAAHIEAETDDAD